jgi:hypothetical protein
MSGCREGMSWATWEVDVANGPDACAVLIRRDSPSRVSGDESVNGGPRFVRVQGCALCRAACITPWYREGAIRWVAECEVCAVPTVI